LKNDGVAPHASIVYDWCRPLAAGFNINMLTLPVPNAVNASRSVLLNATIDLRAFLKKRKEGHGSNTQ